MWFPVVIDKVKKLRQKVNLNFYCSEKTNRLGFLTLSECCEFVKAFFLSLEYGFVFIISLSFQLPYF